MLKINKINKKYDDNIVLQNIELTVPNGQIVGVLGVNGAGKSTLLKICCKLVKADSGIINYDDIDGNFYDKVVFISEEGTFFEDLSVQDNGKYFKALMPQFDLKRYQSLCEYFHLDNNAKAKKLSRGEKSKLELAIGFSKGGKYIFLDEPFLGADIFARKDFLKLMLSSLNKDETLLITTHQVEEIENFLDRVIVLKKGKIVSDMMTQDIESQGKSVKQIFMDCYQDIEQIDEEIEL